VIHEEELPCSWNTYQIWRAKPRVSPREASCEVEAQPHLSHEEKGKAPLSVDSVCKAKLEARGNTRREASFVSPKQRALVASTRFAPLSKVKRIPPSADSVAYAASSFRDASKVPNCKVRTKALYSGSYLRHNTNTKIKPPVCAKSKATIASLPALSSAKLALGGGAKSLTSSGEANAISEVVLTSPVVEMRNLKAKILQLEQPSTRPPSISILDCLSSVSPDLREFLTNK